jgi:hypothetical protein
MKEYWDGASVEQRKGVLVAAYRGLAALYWQYAIVRWAQLPLSVQERVKDEAKFPGVID